MIRSMTGFGASQADLEGATVEVELRSVNSRHLKLNLRLPSGAEGWEAPLRELVSGRLRRGHVDVTLRVGARDGAGDRVVVDEPRVEATLEALRRLARRYEVPGEVDLRLLLSCGEVLRVESVDPRDLLSAERVAEVAGRALAELIEMRGREGERLQAELQERLGAIRAGLEEAERLAPERLVRERERLRRSVAEMVEGLELEPDRLAREVALVADRWDVREEVVRARAHLEAFGELLEAPAGEPVGKRLAFLAQELLREINTLGAKANDAAISRIVVEMKNELESLREQVENVE